MTPQEKRWLDNVKKAFADSDLDFNSPRMTDDCIETLFKGIDTAKTLRLSLLGDIGRINESQKEKFVDFLELSIPGRDRGAREFQLADCRTGKVRNLTISEILYDVRCMIHENENLDESESIDYHILLRWDDYGERIVCDYSDDRIVINARLTWRRLREILADFLTGIQSKETIVTQRKAHVTIRPESHSIQPSTRNKTKDF